jgi:type I restriction enzyme S subunit
LSEGLPYIATKDISYESVINYGNGIKIPDEDKSSFKIASQNTILICAEGGSAGRKIAFTDQEVCFGNKLFALTTTEKVNSRFVYYYYFSFQFQEDFSSQLTGIIGGVSMAKFKKLKVPLPSPPEQQRIVKILDKAFVAIDKAKQNAEQNLKNAKELFESTMSFKIWA